MKLNNKLQRGFLLFEAAVSISIIALGLISVTQAYNASKRSLQLSRELVEVSTSLLDCLSMYEVKGIDANTVQKEGYAKIFGQDYRWIMDVSPISEGELTGLNTVKYTVNKSGGKKEDSYSIETYIKDKGV